MSRTKPNAMTAARTNQGSRRWTLTRPAMVDTRPSAAPAASLRPDASAGPAARLSRRGPRDPATRHGGRGAAHGRQALRPDRDRPVRREVPHLAPSRPEGERAHRAHARARGGPARAADAG